MAATKEALRDRLSLEPPTRQNNLAESLEQLVPRIGTQYNGFRHVTSARLQKEIATKSQQTQTDEDLDQEGDEEEVEKPAEEREGTDEAIFAKRKEMAGFLGAAMQDTLMAVDFISLLETKMRPSAADTMSPALRGAGLPIGCLDHEQWQAQIDAKTAEQARLASLGRTMDSLSSAADVLLGAAERLKTDVQRETQYWKNILSVTERGWSVYRALGRKTVALQFGANEAGPLFRGRGYAELVPNEDGSIGLVQSAPMRPKTLRIRHERNGEIINTSMRTVARREHGSEEELELQIREARDSLFEEELFHEMAMEARRLAPLNVRNRDGVLCLPTYKAGDEEYHYSEQLLIDLVTSDESLEQSTNQPTPSDPGSLAEPLRKFLQLLLCHTYRRRYELRTEIPPPLSEGKRPEIHSSILAPSLTILRHHTALERVINSVRDSLGPLGMAGFTTHFTCGPLVDFGTLSNANDKPTSEDALDIPRLLENLAKPLSTSMHFSIKPGPGLSTDIPDYKLNIDMATQLLSPTADSYGTTCVLRTSLPLDEEVPTTPTPPSPPSTPGQDQPDDEQNTQEFDSTFDDIQTLVETMYMSLSRYLVMSVVRTTLINQTGKLWTCRGSDNRLYAETGSATGAGESLEVWVGFNGGILYVRLIRGKEHTISGTWRVGDGEVTTDKSLGKVLEDISKTVCNLSVAVFTFYRL